MTECGFLLRFVSNLFNFVIPLTLTASSLREVIFFLET